MPRIVTVIGARPQFIKAAAVSRALREQNRQAAVHGRIEEIIVHTGQHYDANMSEVFFSELDIPPPHHHLDIGSGSHGRQTGRMLAALDQVLEQERPDLVLVYGDTNSTLAGVLAAVKMHIPSAHVEAGLRSFNRVMPEEINRVVADACANILYCPTRAAVANLRAEGLGVDAELTPQKGLDRRRAYLVGDVMFDALLFYRQQARQQTTILERLFGHEAEGKSYCLATVHRPANTDISQNLRGILEGLRDVAATGCDIVLPLHPRTRAKMAREGMDALQPASGGVVRLVDPVGYLDMLALEAGARAIFTDSGGVQKEAFFLRVPCITLREETEWVETVSSGWNLLAGASPERVLAAFAQAFAAGDGPPFGGQGGKAACACLSPDHRAEDGQEKDIGPAGFTPPFGDGNAAKKIVRHLAGCLT